MLLRQYAALLPTILPLIIQIEIVWMLNKFIDGRLSRKQLCEGIDYQVKLVDTC